ncbi:AAA family ATPase [archaeon]|jgi:CMP/dCMP kinase|nr:AAA family ATPase [archaeon]MBT3731440.1 AAA family ATPase [archaeon]MBT4670257.1 AAA family ATPase [archaeon]MBT5029725.1 AAA family ATPase [archaeon]MBT5287526.1 AAA family ATPase [archaeon]
MKITLCGRIGSGKSVIAKALAKDLNLKHYSTGDLMREIAKEKGYTIEDFMKIRSDDIDHQVDSRTKKIGEEEDNFIFDSKLAFNFIEDAIKIFLDVTYEEAAKRIFENQRNSEAPASSPEELAIRNKERWEVDRKKYQKLYSVDIDDKKNYDVYIKTTGKPLDEVIQEVKRAILSFSEKQEDN